MFGIRQAKDPFIRTDFGPNGLLSQHHDFSILTYHACGSVAPLTTGKEDVINFQSQKWSSIPPGIERTKAYRKD